MSKPAQTSATLVRPNHSLEPWQKRQDTLRITAGAGRQLETVGQHITVPL
jgi:hypothetical protein